jgi:hypothetical protein
LIYQTQSKKEKDKSRIWGLGFGGKNEESKCGKIGVGVK